jgi:ribosome-associated protein
MTDMNKKTLNHITQIIYDKKGFNILALDVKGISTITDCLLIAEGNVERHLQAITRAIIEDMKKEGIRPLHVEGMEDGNWIVIDYSSIIIHLFLPQTREKYQLEKLWDVGKIVDLQIDVKKQLNETY